MLTIETAFSGGAWIVRNAGGPKSARTSYWLRDNAVLSGLVRTTEGWGIMFSENTVRPKPADYEAIRAFIDRASVDGIIADFAQPHHRVS